MRLLDSGLIQGVRHVASPNCDERPTGERLTLLVVHCISLPPGHFSGNAVERLFTNTLDPSEHPYYGTIAGLRVSAHFFIRRSGELVQFVPCDLRAWHAGASSWRGRSRCNDFSIGVELEGTETSEYAPAQYEVLATLTRALREVHPLEDLAAHSDIAPGRKSDPGPGFDWSRFRADL